MLDPRGATLAGTRGRPNEDAFAILPTLLVVADGATSPPSLGDGCIHGPAWYARHLVAAVVAAHSADPDAAPSDLLASAITRTTDLHSGTCDVEHPGTPSATIAILLFDTSGLGRWLVLGDCTLLHDNGTELLVVTDNRLSNSSLAEREAIKVPGGASDHRSTSEELMRWFLRSAIIEIGRGVSGSRHLIQRPPTMRMSEICSMMHLRQSIALLFLLTVPVCC